MAFKYTAMIIEPRRHKALGFVLKNFLTNLSEDWGVVIFHGINNKDFVEDLFKNELSTYKHRIDKIIQLETPNLTPEGYANLCKSASLYKCIDTDILLKFETDSLILDKNKDLINTFLKYDYVGAPWKNGMVGNGGLCLRRKSKMIEVCEKVDTHFVPQEDIYFSYQKVVPLNKPSFQEAQTFSVETIFHEKSFGIHACWKYMNKYEMEFLINRYPEIQTLIELNK
jgi:hypothetical protein